jgi:DNA-binding response OmpR family regulator
LIGSQILIIEDEEKIARVLQLELSHEGYQVIHADDGRKGLDLALTTPWDLILLDIMLPELSGLEVLRKVRQANKQVPIILLTAREAIPDKVSGLDLGANDYVTKPFSIEELLARIRALLRLSKQQSEEESVIGVSDLRIDLKARKVNRDGQQIELTPKEFDLLFYLVKHKESALPREQILSEVWGYDFVGDTNIVDVYIRYLRQKVDKGFEKKLIHTCRGVGYLVQEA